MKSYKDLVDCYEQGCKTRLNCNLSFCKTLHECTYGYKTHQQGTDNIPCCVPALPGDVSQGKERHYHQNRVPDSVLENFERKISNCITGTYNSFDDLFDAVSAAMGKCLLTYDFCLRYGNSCGLRPKDNVYLFNGAKAGAENLFGHKINDFRLSYRRFSAILGTTLDAAEVEDFLCVCKDHILYITTHSQNCHNKYNSKKHKT